VFEYKTKGTCSVKIQLEIEDGVITHCAFLNGCYGNTEGLARLVTGRNAAETAGRLKGIICRNGTSCPDQLSKAISAYPGSIPKKESSIG